jgi:site-specific DNA-methyltransferase (adenine-specific)/site-specific DNA-methyltransferase (cytosine-N4-specific)
MKAEQPTNCEVICGDSRKILSSYPGQVDLIVTSPPYADARRDHYDSIHPDRFEEWFLTFHESFYNALKPTGSFVLNIKDKVANGVRHRYVWHTIEALSARGWYAIDDYLWHKTNPMPGYWPTRLRDGWEYCFHLAKSERPYFNSDAVRKPIGDWVVSRLAKLGQNDLTRHNSVNASGFGRNISKWVGKHTVLPSNVISLPLVGKNRGHPAVFPVDLPLFFINLLCPPDGLVVDPFAGSGTTGIAALSEGRRCVLIDNNPDYCQLALRRLREETVVSKSNGRYATIGTSEGPQIKLLESPQSVSGTAPKLRSVRYALPKRKRVSKKRRVTSR